VSFDSPRLRSAFSSPWLAALVGAAVVAASLSLTGNLSVGGNGTVTGTLTVNGNVKLGNASTDLVGIGADPEPNGPLSFAAAVGNKLQFYPITSTTQYGVGVQSNQLQIYAPTTTDKVSLGFGDSDAFTEVAAFAGTAGITWTRSAVMGDGNNDEFTIRGNLASTQTAPSVSACGSGGAMVGTSSNNWGSFSIGTGGTGCTLTFSQSFTGGSVHCLVEPIAAATARVGWTTAVGTLTVTGGTAGATYTYFCGCAGSACQ
jgi:hypothetical protein